MANKRMEQFAADLYESGKRFWSISALAEFMECDWGVAANLCASLTPAFGENTGKRYYYRDIAEALSSGGKLTEARRGIR